jgi:hypothetical protein
LRIKSVSSLSLVVLCVFGIVALLLTIATGLLTGVLVSLGV